MFLQSHNIVNIIIAFENSRKWISLFLSLPSTILRSIERMRERVRINQN